MPNKHPRSPQYSFSVAISCACLIVQVLQSEASNIIGPTSPPRVHFDLSGSWKFFPAFEELEVKHAFLAEPLGVAKVYPEDETDRNYGWIEPGFDDSAWWQIQVPGSWNTQFQDLWSYEGLGWYRREIKVPKEWKGKRVVFHSDGANYRTVVYVNGVKAGIHEGGYVAFSIPIHDYIRFGERNVLAIAVDNKSLLERVPMERHDWWDHGGLYRPVYLQVTEPVFIDEVVVETKVEESPAKVYVKSIVFNQTNRIQDMILSATLLDSKGVDVARAAHPLKLESGTASVDLSLAVQDPKRWAPDHPYLYTLVTELRREDPSVLVDSTTLQVGLRSIRIEGPKLLLNGEPFLVKGVNRYENYPDTGMTSTPEALQKDIELIKSLGANTVRCHYTYARETYDLLDREGLFAVCEVPLYQWGRPGHSEKNLEAAKLQLTEMIRTLRNHPSVFMWSVSNETRTRPREEGEEHKKLSEMVVKGNLELIDLAHELDPIRPVLAPSNRWPDDPVFAKTDLLSVNVYLGAKTPHVDSLPEMMNTMHAQMEELRALHPNRPILVTEYGSWALYGLLTDYFPGERYQAALLSEYWKAFLEEPQFNGAIIWCYADSDVHRKLYSLYELRCAYGLYDIHRRPKESARAISDLWLGNGKAQE